MHDQVGDNIDLFATDNDDVVVVVIDFVVVVDDVAIEPIEYTIEH